MEVTKTAFTKNMQVNYGDFVKTTEVKSLIEEIVMPVINGLRIREEEGLRSTNCINTIFKEIKEMQTIKA